MIKSMGDIMAPSPINTNFCYEEVGSTYVLGVDDPSLISTLDPLSLRRKVASLSLFYHYYFGHCSDEFHLQWFGRVPLSRRHLPTTIF